MIESFYIRDSRVIKCEEHAPSDILLCIKPNPEERKMLLDSFGLDEHTLNSALDPDELSRVEIEDDHVAFIMKKPKSYYADSNMYHFQITSVGVFLFESKAIIVADSAFPFPQDKRFAKVPSRKTLVLKVLSYCTYHFMEHLRIISMLSDELEQKINQSLENRYLIFMFSLGKGLVYYLSAINSNNMLLQKLSATHKIEFNEEERELLEELLVDNNQCCRIAEIYSNILSSMMDARASIVNNNLNQLMKRLTLITIGIMLPTFVVSLFSMNVAIPMADFRHAFWIILAMAAISVVGVVFYTRAKKW